MSAFPFLVAQHKQRREYEKVEGHGIFDGAYINVDILSTRLLNTVIAKAPAIIECWVEWIHPVSSKLINKLVGLIEVGAKGVRSLPVKDVITEIQIGFATVGINWSMSENEVVTALKESQSECELEEGKRMRESQNHVSTTEVPKSEIKQSPVKLDYVIDEEGKMRESTVSLDSLPGSVEYAPILHPDSFHIPVDKDIVRVPAVHVLDIGILNTYMNTANTDSSIGAHVKYYFESTALISDNHSQSLWWDSDCRILNGRAEHRFLLECADDLMRLMETGWVMIIDQDQGLDDPSSIQNVGSAYIDAATIESIFTGSLEQKLIVPVLSTHGELICDLELCFTHHIEPPILRPAENALRISVDSLEPPTLVHDDDQATLRLQIEKIINLSNDTALDFRCACFFLPDEVSELKQSLNTIIMLHRKIVLLHTPPIDPLISCHGRMKYYTFHCLLC